MKTASSLEAIVAQIPDGASIMIGGFLGVGTPHRLIQGLVSAGRTGLTVITNDTHFPGIGIGRLIEARLVAPDYHARRHQPRNATPDDGRGDRRRARSPGNAGRANPVRRPRPRGRTHEDRPGHVGGKGKSTIEIDGETWLLEKPLRADVALICARQADALGNLTYELTAQNFNPLMAMAAGTVIAEADEFVPVGGIPPDAVRTPGILVDYLLERPQ